jgi:hypothetical protein
VVKVAGAEVSSAAICELALRLRNAREYSLANRLSRALDNGSNEIALTARERAQLLDALQRHVVVGMEELELRLVDRSHARMAVRVG